MTARPPVSETIKKAMELGDISEAELARTTKLPQATINKILHRLTKDPRLSTIVVIAEALNVSITQLAGIDPLPRNAEERLGIPKKTLYDKLKKYQLASGRTND